MLNVGKGSLASEEFSEKGKRCVGIDPLYLMYVVWKKHNMTALNEENALPKIEGCIDFLLLLWS